MLWKLHFVYLRAMFQIAFRVYIFFYLIEFDAFVYLCDVHKKIDGKYLIANGSFAE